MITYLQYNILFYYILVNIIIMSINYLLVRHVSPCIDNFYVIVKRNEVLNFCFTYISPVGVCTQTSC